MLRVVSTYCPLVVHSCAANQKLGQQVDTTLDLTTTHKFQSQRGCDFLGCPRPCVELHLRSKLTYTGSEYNVLQIRLGGDTY